MTYARHITQAQTPQSQPIFGREHQMAKNDAGGYAFKLGKWGHLERFLVLGSEGGTYYVREQQHSQRNIKNVLECIKEDGKRVVDTAVAISKSGVAPKNDPALFVLALCISPKYADAQTRRYAAENLPAVARIGTHLFTFAEEADQLRGWGSLLKNAVGGWYLSLDVDHLAYQIAKYQQRVGWSHRDLLRKTHPVTEDSARAALFDYITHGFDGMNAESAQQLPDILYGVENIRRATSTSEVVAIISKHRLTHEMVPNDFKQSEAVWNALLQDMPMMAMVRNLATMTARGLLTQTSAATQLVVSRLMDEERLSKSMIHPISLLSAWNTYRSGHGFRGKLTWKPADPIVRALESAFYTSFGFIPATGKRLLLALDVSGSMSVSLDQYGLNMSARDATAVMAMVTAKREPMYHSMAFSDGRSTAWGRRDAQAMHYPLNSHDSLETVVHRMAQMPFGGTDCSLPMIYANNNKLEVDAIVIYTDSETWAGSIQPVEALRMYRQKYGIPTKLIVVAMTSTGFTIADPEDPFMLDVVGFDTRVPKLIADFASA